MVSTKSHPSKFRDRSRFYKPEPETLGNTDGRTMPDARTGRVNAIGKELRRHG